MILRKILFQIIFLASLQIFANENSAIDSLQSIFSSSRNHKERVEACFQLINLYKNTNNDSAAEYQQKAMEIINLLLEKDSSNIDYQILKVRVVNYAGVICHRNNEFNKAIKNYLHALNYLNHIFEKKPNRNYSVLYIKLYSDLAASYEKINDFENSKLYNQKTYLLDSINGDKFGIGEYYLNLAIIEYRQGNYQKSKDYCLKTLDYKKKNNVLDGIDRVYTNAGNACMSMGDYASALDYYFETLKIDEKNKNFAEIAEDYNSIGNVFYLQKEYEKAIEYYKKHNEISKQINSLGGMATSYGNIANVLAELGKYNEAVMSYKNAIEILEKTENIKHLSALYNNLGQTYNENKQYDKALEYFNKSLKIKEKLDDKQGMTILCSNIADMYFQLKNYSLAKTFAEQCLQIAKEIGSIYDENYAYGLLSEISEATGDFKNALAYYKLYFSTNDSLYNAEKSNLIADVETKYQTEKKQKEIELLNKDKQLKVLEINEKQQEIQRQNIYIIVFIIGLLIIAGFSFMLYRQSNARKKANILLKQQKEEIEAQRDEIEKHRDVILEQKNEIEDSINYAKRIQEAVLPISDLSRAILGEHFILFKPKDIVSGDFYFIAKIEKTLIAAVADCTGHGVPGAFMSMLGISFLNEIVRKQEITKANEVLNELRKEIIMALQQTGQYGEQKDGMDISLIAIKTTPQAQTSEGSTQTSEGFEPSEVLMAYSAQWAGANNPLWVIRNNKPLRGFGTLEGVEQETLEELKGDKMPIAIYDRMNDFTNHELQLFPGDIIYLKSDGYEDQFGGPKSTRGGKKFLSKNLKQLLIANCRLNIAEQKQILEKTLVDWIGNGEQIDDITILGIKI